MRDKFWAEFTSPMDALMRNREEVPDKTGFIILDQGETEKESISYQDLDDVARKIAAFLQKKYSPGDRALLLYPTSLDFYTAFYGCLYAGIIPIPANPPKINRSADRLLAIVKDADAKLALATDDFLVDLPKRIDQIPQLGEIIFINHTKMVEEGDASAWEKPEIRLEDLAFIQYTSGSTQTPKGVQITFENIFSNCRMINVVRKVEPADLDERVMVSWLPIFHDMGLITSMFQCVYDRTLTVLMTPVAFLQKPVRWLQAITKYRATGSGAPNFAYELCVNKVKAEELEGLDLSSWKLAYNSSEPVRLETMEKFLSMFGKYGFQYSAFVPCYGLAEATLLMTFGQQTSEVDSFWADRTALENGRAEPAQPGDAAAVSIVSCGKPVLDGRVMIVDPDKSMECAPGMIGEIWVSGSNVSPGYWKRPDDSKRSFQATLSGSDKSSYLRTGDLGFVHDGHLYVAGRLKDLLIVRGRNYFPQDIEVTVWKSHPVLMEEGGAAFAYMVDGQEKLGVVQEVKREFRKSINVEEVLKTVRFAIAREQGIRAHAVLLIQPYSLPKTSSGKVMRSESKRMFLNNEFRILGEWRSPDSQGSG